MPDNQLPLLSPLQPAPPSGPAKKPYRSKTLWANLIMGLLLLYPRTAPFVSQYPAIVTLVIVGVNFVLRLVTHGRISLED